MIWQTKVVIGCTAITVLNLFTYYATVENLKKEKCRLEKLAMEFCVSRDYYIPGQEEQCKKEVYR